MYGYMDIWICGYMDIFGYMWIYRYIDILITMIVKVERIFNEESLLFIFLLHLNSSILYLLLNFQGLRAPQAIATILLSSIIEENYS